MITENQHKLALIDQYFKNFEKEKSKKREEIIGLALEKVDDFENSLDRKEFMKELKTIGEDSVGRSVFDSFQDFEIPKFLMKFVKFIENADFFMSYIIFSMFSFTYFFICLNTFHYSPKDISFIDVLMFLFSYTSLFFLGGYFLHRHIIKKSFKKLRAKISDMNNNPSFKIIFDGLIGKSIISAESLVIIKQILDKEKFKFLFINDTGEINYESANYDLLLIKKKLLKEGLSDKFEEIYENIK